MKAERERVQVDLHSVLAEERLDGDIYVDPCWKKARIEYDNDTGMVVEAASPSQESLRRAADRAVEEASRRGIVAAEEHDDTTMSWAPRPLGQLRNALTRECISMRTRTIGDMRKHRDKCTNPDCREALDYWERVEQAEDNRTRRLALPQGAEATDPTVHAW